MMNGHQLFRFPAQLQIICSLGKKMHAADLGAELPSAEVSWQWKGCLSDQYWVLRQRYCVVG